MGLLDWLTGDIGGGMGGPSPGAMANPMGDMTGANPMTAPPQIGPPEPMSSGIPPDLSGGQSPGGMPTAAMPPVQPAGAGAPQSPFAQGGDPMAGGGQSNGPGLPPPLPPPISVPPRGAPDASMLPPAAAPTSGVGGPMSLAPPAVTSGPAQEAPASATGFLGRALGMDANRERSLKGSLAAGFKAAGDSAGKSPFQALSSGAGASIEGGQKAADTGYDQRLKSLKLAVDAQSAGDKAAYNKNYAAYLGKKLSADTDKAAGGGKGSAWNKPDSQKFLDAQRGVSQDPNVKASLKGLETLQKTGSPEEIAAAKAAHEGLVSSTEQKYLVGVGLDPKKAVDLVKNPPGSQTNPMTITSKADFDIYVKPGQAYINPADGKVYIRKGADGAPPAGGAPTPPAAPQPPRLPTSPTLDDEE